MSINLVHLTLFFTFTLLITLNNSQYARQKVTNTFGTPVGMFFYSLKLKYKNKHIFFIKSIGTYASEYNIGSIQYLQWGISPLDGSIIISNINSNSVSWGNSTNTISSCTTIDLSNSINEQIIRKIKKKKKKKNKN